MPQGVWVLLVLVVLRTNAAWAQTPPTGFFGVSGPDWTQAGGKASAPSSFALTRWNTPFGPNQQAACTVAGLPASGSGFHINVRIQDNDNRYRFFVTNVPGADNDTATIVARIAGVDTIVAGPINLGVDLQVGDKIGVEVASNVMKGNVWSLASAWASTLCGGGGDWCTVATHTIVGTPPASSYIGMAGAAPVACDLFAGQGDAVTGDTIKPTPDPPTWPATPLVVQSDTAIQVTANACTDNSGVVVYQFRRCSGAACTPTTIVRQADTPTFLDGGLTAGTLYRYTNACTDGTNTTGQSTVVEATTLSTPDPAPGIPGNFSVVLGPHEIYTSPPLTISSATVQISYTVPTGNPVEYRLERGRQADCADCVEICQTTALAVTTSALDSAPCPIEMEYDTVYFHRVRAANAADLLGGYTAILGVTLPPRAQFFNVSGRAR